MRPYRHRGAALLARASHPLQQRRRQSPLAPDRGGGSGSALWVVRFVDVRAVVAVVAVTMMLVRAGSRVGRRRCDC
jgi:hypothetical protein